MLDVLHGMLILSRHAIRCIKIPVDEALAAIKAQDRLCSRQNGCAHSSSHAIVLSVQVESLLESGVDPAEKDSRGRTAYSLAGDKQVRDTFRRYDQCVEEPDALLPIPSPPQQQDETMCLPQHECCSLRHICILPTSTGSFHHLKLQQSDVQCTFCQMLHPVEGVPTDRRVPCGDGRRTGMIGFCVAESLLAHVVLGHLSDSLQGHTSTIYLGVQVHGSAPRAMGLGSS